MIGATEGEALESLRVPCHLQRNWLIELLHSRPSLVAVLQPHDPVV